MVLPDFINRFVPRKNREQLLKYWESPTDIGNRPESYLTNIKASDFLVKVFLKYVKPDEDIKILELGCNVGRNLNVLYKSGFHNLESIEINKDAIELMKKEYPVMYQNSKINNSTIEQGVNNYNDSTFDLVFSNAVLMHLHSDSKLVFKEIARITKKYLVVMESEQGTSKICYPRNYKKIFEKYGFTQLTEKRNLEHTPDDYILRVFQRNVVEVKT